MKGVDKIGLWEFVSIKELGLLPGILGFSHGAEFTEQRHSGHSKKRRF